MVQTFKAGMKKQEGSLEVRLSRFLFSYRIIPHSTTGVSPSELMFNRRLRIPLDSVRPDQSKHIMKKQQQQKFGHDVRCKDRQLSRGNIVYAKNYGAGPMWLPGTVETTIGSTMYEVRSNDGNTMRRHIEQLRPRCQPESADQHVNPEEVGHASSFM